MLGDWLQNAWTTLFFSLIWPMWKWILRRATGKCELLRITYEEPKGAKRSLRIERSLKLSNVPYLHQLSKEEDVDILVAADEVMKIKQIVPEVHMKFKGDFQDCLCQICGYKRLKREVEMMRKTFYSHENPEHEEKLMQLWDILMPSEKLESRKSKQWSTIGFQGEDPMTDFRGMGILGLNQLLYFAIKYPDQCKTLLSRSHHPKYGYSFAIVGINLTSMTYEALRKGSLRTHFYNVTDKAPKIQDFHEVYCHVFWEFDKFWFDEEPEDIMQFGPMRDKFNRRLLHKLSKSQTILQSDFQQKE
ncbi:ELMO domain-containing protein 2-like [Crassostrea virginica]|uniref:ELMO domain-containing protein 2-like isoform X2 n=1 Tax=Crassostrea virginica TaxID=6565 RepID=A0A8B8DG92_CRAVI|nr:ELMO domain-containing protein 2-like isoform X2 [Crassostrea virginica]